MIRYMAKYKINIDEVLNITKALSDENRVRALMMLGGGELCVCQIIEMLSLAPSTVSKHMSILRQAGLVQTRKDGRWIYYRLSEDMSTAAKEAVNWLYGSLKDCDAVLSDTVRLSQMKNVEKKELCRCYK